MANRITASELRLALEVPPGATDPMLEGYISDAHLLVEEELVGKGLSEGRLTVIEKYLSAHFALMLLERGGLVSSKDGEAQDNYVSLSPLGNGNIGGLQLTRYGQQAMVMDTSGTLVKMSSQRLKARFTVITGLEEQPTIVPSE